MIEMESSSEGQDKMKQNMVVTKLLTFSFKPFLRVKIILLLWIKMQFIIIFKTGDKIGGTAVLIRIK